MSYLSNVINQLVITICVLPTTQSVRNVWWVVSPLLNAFIFTIMSRIGKNLNILLIILKQ